MSNVSIFIAADGATDVRRATHRDQQDRTRGGLLPAADDEQFGSIDFDFDISDAEFTDECRGTFKTDFCRELTRLRQWALAHDWPGLAVSHLHVLVSDRFRISRALVPAWSGQCGHIKFPAWRVIDRKAAIAHELVHVFYPNGNRFLSEGLAIHLQADFGTNPAFPNFGRPLHDMWREQLGALPPNVLARDPDDASSSLLAALDAIATPSPLTCQIGDAFYGEDARGQAFIYVIAGSFVQFLIATRGLDAFRRLYEITPLLPLQLAGGLPERWRDVYGQSLFELEREWMELNTTKPGQS